MLSSKLFGIHEGKEAHEFHVSFPGKMSFRLISYGAIIREISIPDKSGNMDNVVLSFDSLRDYVRDKHYIGAAIGRYANRIRNGCFSLNDQNVQLSQNSGKHHLHGGFEGFNRKVWNVENVVETEKSVRIELSHFSAEGEEGYPGNLNVKLSFEVSESSISMDFTGQSDRDTIFNPSHHSYFNLTGRANEDIAGHLLKIDSDKILEVDTELIPTGNFLSPENTESDFRSFSNPINEIDSCYAFSNTSGNLELRHPTTGRVLRMNTTAPSVQVFTANIFDSSIAGSGGRVFKKHHSICIEPQYFPDSPNHSNFPDTVIRAGETRRIRNEFQFDLIKE